MIEARQWNASSLERGYDGLVVALGFETRARFVSSQLVSRSNIRVACGFADRQVHAYETNARWFRAAGFEVSEITDSEFTEWLRSLLSRIDTSARGEEIRLVFDISSLSRVRMATIVDSIRSYPWSREVDVDFLYAPAQFSPPPTVDEPNIHVGPVLPSFAGWTEEPDRPAITILGLGYEQDRALGAVEHTQPGQVWTFMPISAIGEYDEFLSLANNALLEGVRLENQLSYIVEQPFECFVQLESLVYSCSRRGNTVLFPFGPKLFTICCLLVASIHRNVAVWRVSAGTSGEPLDRIARGDVLGLKMHITSGVDLSELTDDLSYTASA
jgi:hypothetical protein